MNPRAILWTSLCLTAVAATSGLAWSLTRAARLDAELQETRRELRAIQTRPAPAPAPAPFKVERLPPAEPAPSPDPQGDLAALQARIQELEGWVYDRDNAIRSLQTQIAAASAPQPPPREAGPSWMEDLRQNDPERYQQILQSRTEARQRLHASLVEKSEFLFGRDLENLPPDEMERYNQMSQLLQDTWALSQAIDTEGLEREQRREIRSQLMEKLDQLGPLMEAERNQEFLGLAKAFGYKDEEAWQFVDYINQVNDVTSLRPIYQNLWGGRGRGPFGGGRDR